MSRRAEEDRPVCVIVTGGGTGGHVYPALTTVRTLQLLLSEQDRDVSVVWVGAHDGLEQRVAGRAGIEFRAVATGKLRRARNPVGMLAWANIKDMLRVPRGAVQALSIVRDVRPDVAVGFGGYVSVPVSFATWLSRRPLVVHEQTVRLGSANRLLARLTTAVAVSSDHTVGLLPRRVRRRALVVGNPVRPQLFRGDADKAVSALGLTGFDRSLPTVYVTGGAQGAQQVNRLLTELLPWLLERANVVHACGPANLERQQKAAAELPPESAARYHVAAFFGRELPHVYALADLVVSRSGAGTIAELTALGKPAVLIPLSSSAGGEQMFNAQNLQRRGAARALIGEVVAGDLRAAIDLLLSDPVVRAEMAAHARDLGRPDAARALVDLILQAAGRDPLKDGMEAGEQST